MTKLISHEVQHIQLIIYCLLLLSMRNISEKLKRKSNTHLLCNNFFLINHAIYEVMWKNKVEPGKQQLTIWRMYTACWIPMVRNTHSVLCNTSRCSIATMVPHTHLNITLYIHYLFLTLFIETNFCAQKLTLINSIIKDDAWLVQQT